MNQDLFDPQNHLTDQALRAMSDGILNEEDLLAAAEHLASCTKCALNLADILEKHGLEKVPAGFTEEVKIKISQKQTEKKIQFVFYSFRVAVAACAAIALVFLGAFRVPASLQSGAHRLKPADNGVVDTITSRLKNFSQQVVNLEAFYHEKEKK